MSNKRRNKEQITIFVRLNKFDSMKKLFFIPLLFPVNQALSQYYYKDIVCTQQSAAQMQLYKQQAVKKISVLSFEADNTPVKDLEIAAADLGKQGIQFRSFNCHRHAHVLQVVLNYARIILT